MGYECHSTACIACKCLDAGHRIWNSGGLPPADNGRKSDGSRLLRPRRFCGSCSFYFPGPGFQ
jgi:hypothetical protein